MTRRQPRYSSPADVLSRGYTSVVVRATDLDTGAVVAAKLMKDRAAALHEAGILLLLDRHPNVLPLLDRVDDMVATMTALVMPLYAMDLGAFVGSGGVFPHPREIEAQLALALRHVHARDVLHLDIKTKNVLVADDRRTAVLCDFGSAYLRAEIQPGTRVRNTAEYQAPEMRRGVVDFPCDVFALGVVFCKLGAPLPLTAAMTRADPAERPSAAEVAAMAGCCTE